MTDTMDMTVVQPLSMTIMTEGTTTVMGSFATSRRDDGVGDGRQEDRGLEDPVLTSFWDLVPDIVEVYMRGSAGAGAVGTGAVSSPSVARVEALPDDAPDSIAIPLQSMRFDNKPIRTKIRTAEEKRAEIMAKWQNDARYRDLFDSAVIVVVDDADDNANNTASGGSPDDSTSSKGQSCDLSDYVGQAQSTHSLKLKQPMLLSSAHPLASQAYKVFKKIATYMMDRKSSKTPLVQAHELLEVAIRAPEALRDEILVQVMKQTNENPSPESTVRGWRLLSLCLGHFPPSSQLAPYVKSYVASAIQSSSSEVVDIAKYCMSNVAQVVVSGARVHAASNAEIAACERRRPVVVKIWHSSDPRDVLRVAVEPHTTVRATVQAVSVRLGITMPAAFGLSVRRRKGALRQEMAAYEKVLDVVSECLMAGRAKDKDNATVKGKARTPKASSSSADEADLVVAMSGIDVGILFHARLLIASKNASLSDGELHIFFQRCVSDVLAGHYPADEKDLMALAVIQCYAQRICKDAKDSAGASQQGMPETLPRTGSGASAEDQGSDWLFEYLPADIIAMRSRPYLQKRLMTDAVKTMEGKSRRDAEMEYLRYTEKWPTSGGTFFAATRLKNEAKGNEDQPVLLCVTERGLHCCDPGTKAVRQMFPYARIKTMGDVNGNLLSVVAGSDLHEFRMQFLTDQAPMIHDLMQEYISVMASTHSNVIQDVITES